MSIEKIQEVAFENEPTDETLDSISLKELLENDITPAAVGAIIRENIRLSEDIGDLKRKNIKVWSVAGVQAGLLFFIIFAGVSWFPKYRFVATTDNSGLCEISSEMSVRVTPAVLTDYAKEAVLNAYSYDYVNYQKTLNEVTTRWFTDAGRKALFSTLESSGNLERIIKGRLILKSMATNVPQLEEEGLKNGITPYWVVKAPVAIEFYSGGEAQPRSRQDFLAIVTVIQIPASAANLKGIAVDSIALQPLATKR